MVRVAGIDLRVLRFPGEGVLPLLLLHGWPTSFLLFHSVIGELRKACSELVLVSMPGFGAAPLLRASWSALDSSKLLLKMMEALGFSRFAVHGEDWGSTVEDKARRDLKQYATDGSASLRLQAERPDSLAFALADSPVGLLAWQLDKYGLWQGTLGGDFGIGDDFIFANATLYSLTNGVATSMRLYAPTELVNDLNDFMQQIGTHS